MTKTNSSRKLLHLVRGQIINPAKMESILSETWITNYRIGALPINTIKNVPKSEISHITKRADAAFSDFVQQFNKTHLDDLSSETTIMNSIKQPLAYLESSLREIFKTDNITAIYCESGAFTYCFYIKINDDAYALQVFISKINLFKNKSEILHGAVIEPQNAFTIYKLYSHGRIVRPFMARISSTEYMPNAYILSKYILRTHDTKQPRGYFLPRRDRVISDDANRFGSNNTINGVIVDIGGFYYNSEYISDPKLRTAWTSFAQMLDSIDLRTSHAYRAHKALYEIYKDNPDKFFDTTLWPTFISQLNTNDQPSGKKLLRFAARLKRKVNKFATTETWPKLKELLHQDFIEIFPLFRFNADIDRDTYLDFPAFYPHLICDILGTNNVPPLEKFASELAEHNHNKVEFIICGMYDTKTPLRWSKYYSSDDVIRAIVAHPEYDWSAVLNDFAPKNIFGQFKNYILNKLKNKTK